MYLSSLFSSVCNFDMILHMFLWCLWISKAACELPLMNWKLLESWLKTVLWKDLFSVSENFYHLFCRKNVLGADRLASSFCRVKIPDTPCRKSTQFWLVCKLFYNGCLWYNVYSSAMVKNVFQWQLLWNYVLSVRGECSSCKLYNSESFTMTFTCIYTD